ncbi:MAG: ABC-2 type transport system ATP-binding protein [Cellvibrionaceae bacterium]|jgi:ABC-2 type transport system ATP-binding protein
MLRTENLSKSYDSAVAVHELNLNIAAGEIYGFLGPNGAGKTTTIRLLLGLLKPTSGRVFLFDEPITNDIISLKRRIGVVAEEPPPANRMTAWELVRFFADLNQVAHPEARMEKLFHALELWEVRHALASAYSRGMRQKLSLIRALIHTPDLLILDEPVSGLDPFGIRQVRAVIDEHREQGGAVLISSHILSEVERSADRIGIMHQGHLLVEDSISGIRARIGGTNIIHIELVGVPVSLSTQLNLIPEVQKIETKENQLTLHLLSGRDARPDIFQAVVATGAILVSMKMEEISLEEAFVTITNQNVQQLAGAG